MIDSRTSMGEGGSLGQEPSDVRAASHPLELLALRCEVEEPSQDLDECIWSNIADDFSYETTPRYTTSLDAAVTLEPKDAMEICVRRYPTGMYARITLASGKLVYSECLDRPITEAQARCAAALRARATLVES